MKKLVAYFSATGTTKRLAQNLARVLNAVLFEIKPLKPYTSADLNWNNPSSRSSLEMRNVSSRPEIANRVTNMEEYDTIFVGFPIWWYVAPTIINTFLEAYNLSCKTIVPFATSGGSGMGNVNEKLASSCRGARLKEGKRFSAYASDGELKSWAESVLGLYNT